jgi:hypothetical protein
MFRAVRIIPTPGGAGVSWMASPSVCIPKLSVGETAGMTLVEWDTAKGVGESKVGTFYILPQDGMRRLRISR